MLGLEGLLQGLKELVLNLRLTWKFPKTSLSPSGISLRELLQNRMQTYT